MDFRSKYSSLLQQSALPGSNLAENIELTVSESPPAVLSSTLNILPSSLPTATPVDTSSDVSRLLSFSKGFGNQRSREILKGSLEWSCVQLNLMFNRYLKEADSLLATTISKSSKRLSSTGEQSSIPSNQLASDKGIDQDVRPRSGTAIRTRPFNNLQSITADLGKPPIAPTVIFTNTYNIMSIKFSAMIRHQK